MDSLFVFVSVLAFLNVVCAIPAWEYEEDNLSPTFMELRGRRCSCSKEHHQCGCCLRIKAHPFHKSIDANGLHCGYSHVLVNEYPADFLRDVVPLPAHSHNDYWRAAPLFSAVQAGCTAVEVDVWQFDGEAELFVGHDLVSLSRGRTFASLYVEPLVELLERANRETPFTMAGDAAASPNGIFDTDRSQTLVLMVDVKTDGAKTWPLVVAQLQPLRERGWLSHVDFHDGGGGDFVLGPVTVVGSGSTPFDAIVHRPDAAASSSSRDAFFDAPLQDMFEEEEEGDDDDGEDVAPAAQPWDVYNTTNSFYASAGITAALGPIEFAAAGISDDQLRLMRGQIRGAHRRGLKVRYWGLPSWPIRIRNDLWSLLLAEGVDYLNIDDMQGIVMF